MSNKKIFIDTETTGLSAFSNQIAQLSYLIIEDSEIVQAKNFFFTVDKVDEGAERVHGLSKEILEKLSQGKVFKDYAEEIARDFTGKTVIGHNVSFDLSFLKAELLRAGITLDIQESFCTMNYYTDICKIGYNSYYSYYNSYKWPKLEEVLYYLGIDSKYIYNKSISLFGESKEFHDSRYDITATYEIYNKIN